MFLPSSQLKILYETLLGYIKRHINGAYDYSILHGMKHDPCTHYKLQRVKYSPDLAIIISSNITLDSHNYICMHEWTIIITLCKCYTKLTCTDSAALHALYTIICMAVENSHSKLRNSIFPFWRFRNL